MGHIGFGSLTETDYDYYYGEGEEVEKEEYKVDIRSYRFGAGAAYNVSDNWAIVAEAGWEQVTYEEDDDADEYGDYYEDENSKIFSSLGIKLSF